MKKSIVIILLIVLILCIIWYFQNQSNQPQQNRKTTSSEIPPIGQRTKEDGCVINGPFPDKACTPGAIFPNVTAEDICKRGYAKNVRNVPVSIKRQVYSEYSIRHHSPGEYEVDHYISLELGGSNDIANLFPEAAEPRPGFHEKDKVENFLHEQVCSGQMTLSDAQKRIANNWLEIYETIKN